MNHCECELNINYVTSQREKENVTQNILNERTRPNPILFQKKDAFKYICVSHRQILQELAKEGQVI